MDEPLVSTEPLGGPLTDVTLDNSVTGPQDRENLKSDFNAFFEELDSKGNSSEAPPSAKRSLPKSKPDKVEPVDREVEPRPERAESKAPRKEAPRIEDSLEQEPALKSHEKAAEPDDEIDQLDLHPNAGSGQKGQFKKLKELAKTFRNKSKLWEDKFAPALKEIGYELSDDPEGMAKVLEDASSRIKGLKNGAPAPEVEQELNELRRLSRTVGLVQDHAFQREFVKPVQRAFVDTLEDLAQYFPCDPAVLREKFLDPLTKKFSPDHPGINSDWWSQQIQLASRLDPISYQRILAKIGHISELQRTRNVKAAELTSEAKGFEGWMQHSQQEYAQSYEAQVRDEVEAAFTKSAEMKELAECRPKDPASAKSANERAVIEKHNQKFEVLQNEFKQVLLDYSTGPRSAARRALEHLDMRRRLEDYTSLKEEVTRLRKQLGLRARVSEVPLRQSLGRVKDAPAKTKLPLNSKDSLKSVFDAWDHEGN